jgi:uncharacterized DUF497 family protein
MEQEKRLSQFQKHGIHFSEASTVFHDENAREYFDPDHSEKEDRFFNAWHVPQFTSLNHLILL